MAFRNDTGQSGSGARVGANKIGERGIEIGIMAAGIRHQLKEAIVKGIDMFDCMSPMRDARHGNVLLSDGTKLLIRRAENATDHTQNDADSPASISRKHTKAYFRH